MQPRQPCYKLNVRFADGGMAGRFARLKRPGIYFRGVEPGTVQASDPLALLEQAPTALTIQTLSDLLLARVIAPRQLAEALAPPHLPAWIKDHLRGL